MENNTQDFTMQDYTNFVNQIKAGCPVHKINFSVETPNAIAGMYIMTVDNPIS